MTCSEWFKVVADGMVAAGTFLGGGAAAVAVFFAVRDGRSALQTWRTQRAEDKRAEVAGQVLAAILRFVEALRTISSSWGERTMKPDEPTEGMAKRDADRKEFAAELARRWNVAHEELVRFYDAQDLAHAYLPGAPVELLEAVDAKRREIYANQMTCTLAGVYGSGGYPGVFEKAFGSKCHEELDALKAKAKLLLGPIARRETASTAE